MRFSTTSATPPQLDKEHRRRIIDQPTSFIYACLAVDSVRGNLAEGRPVQATESLGDAQLEWIRSVVSQLGYSHDAKSTFDPDATLEPHNRIEASLIDQLKETAETLIAKAGLEAAADSLSSQLPAGILRQLDAVGLGRNSQPATTRKLQSQQPDYETLAEATTAADGAYTGPNNDVRGQSSAASLFQEAAARFQPVRFHARGGLGQIHIARDGQLRREVALKTIRPHLSQEPGSQSRFVLEGEVTGQLEHPGVVPVYGMGSNADGSPYYAMRLIDGESLSAKLKQLHHSNSGTTRQDRLSVPTLRRLLNRYVSVCQTISYAHSRGVLHRDLKPDNIMLGAFGETLVVDWGIAKIIGQPDSLPQNSATCPAPSFDDLPSSPFETLRGSVTGTVAYMSPEQALGSHDAVDQRSDVFSLGVVLFEILLGRTLYESETMGQALNQARECQPVFARQIDATIPRPLESICLKATRRNPLLRYQSAAELADDVEAYLSDQRVMAHRDTVAERTARWARNHRTLVSTCVGVGLVALVASATITFVLSTKNREIAAANLEIEKERDAAEDNLLTARSAVTDYLGMLSRDERLRENGLDRLRLNLASAAAPYYEKFLGNAPNDPQLAFEQAELKASLGEIAFKSESTTAALEHLREAEKTLSGLASSDADEELYKVALCSTLLRRAMCEIAVGEFSSGESGFRDALELVGAVDETTFDRLVAEFSSKSPFGQRAWQLQRAHCYDGIALVGLQRGKFTDAERASAEAAKSVELAVSKLSADDEAFSSLSPLFTQVDIVMRQGKFSQATDLLQSLLDRLSLASVSLEDDTRSPNSAERLNFAGATLRIEALARLGQCQLDTGYCVGSIESLTAAYSLSKRLSEQYPENIRAQNTFAVMSSMLEMPGNFVALRSATRKAAQLDRLASLETASNAMQKVYSQDPRNLANADNYVASLRMLSGQYQAVERTADASKFAIEAVEIASKSYTAAKESWLRKAALVNALFSQADMRSVAADTQRARTTVQQAIELAGEMSSDAPMYALSLIADGQMRLAQLATEAGPRLTHARKRLEAAQRLLKQLDVPMSHYQVSMCFQMLAESYRLSGDIVASRNALRQGIQAALNGKALAPQEPQYSMQAMYIHLQLATSIGADAMAEMETLEPLGDRASEEIDALPLESISHFRSAVAQLDGSNLRWLFTDLINQLIEALDILAAYDFSVDEYATAAVLHQTLDNLYAELIDRTGDREYYIMRAENLHQLHVVLYNTDDLAASLTALQDAETAITGWLNIDVSDIQARRVHTDILFEYADFLMRDGDNKKALEILDRLIELSIGDVAPHHRLMRALCNARTAKYLPAVLELQLAESEYSFTSTDAYNAAIVYAHAVESLDSQVQDLSSYQLSTRKQYIDLAVDRLRADWENSEYSPEESLEYLETDDELDPLRGEEPFDSLLKQCRAEVAPSK